MENRENNIYRATIMNAPTGKNQPIVKFSLWDRSIIEKEIPFGTLNWGKGQTLLVKYEEGQLKLLESPHQNALGILPLMLLYFIVSATLIYAISKFEFVAFLIPLLGILLFALFVGGIILFIVLKNKNKNKMSQQKSRAKVIAFVPIFKMHSTRKRAGTNHSYFAMEWRALFEYRALDGEIYRCLQNDEYFGDDRNPYLCDIPLEGEVPIKYDENNPQGAFLDIDEYPLEFHESHRKKGKAKVINKELYQIDSLEKENMMFSGCFEQEYLICEYEVEGKRYQEKSYFPLNKDMYSIGDEINIQYEVATPEKYVVYEIDY